LAFQRVLEFTMTTTIANSDLPVARPAWDSARLQSRIVHLGCGAFHRAHQALYTHHLLETTDSDWGSVKLT
jgi:fructuronate reductase